MNREAIEQLVAPVIRAFSDQVVELVLAETEQLLEQAKAAALAAFVGDRDLKPAKKPVRARKARKPRAPVVVEVAPVTKKPRRCSRCDEVGHRSDRCPLGVSLPEALDRQTASPPPVTKSDRFSRIEQAARVRRGEA